LIYGIIVVMKEAIFGFLDLIFELAEKELVGLNKKEKLRAFLFTLSIFGIPALFVWQGRAIFAGLDFKPVFGALFFFAPIWVPLILLELFLHAWFEYIRMRWIAGEGFAMIEIKIPKETMKSPSAMEIFITSLHQTGTATFIDTYWKGKVRPWFSLEIVSIDGKVRFFIWMHKKYREHVETQLYAQYPDIEVYEVEDYMLSAKHDPENFPCWGTYFRLDKADVYPIKTYVDYGLLEDPKEEFKIDPLTSTLESLGTLRKGEQIWIQILIQAHKKMGFKEGFLFPKEDWRKEIEEEIEKIRKEATPETEGEYPGIPLLTKGQQEKIASLERSAGKFPFECAVRAFYYSTKEAFNTARFPAIISLFKQYSSNYLNGFKIGQYTDFDYPWQDYKRFRRNNLERKFLDALKRRSFFQPPYKFYRAKPIILMTEEIATIYHFPGSVARTPTLSRIPSKRVEAPANLPT